MSVFRTTDFYLEVAKGNVDKHSIFNIAATNPSVGTTEEDVWDAGGAFVYPTGNESWEFISADANDTAAGTGAQEVTIRYMDSTYVEQTPAVVATNGGTITTGISDGFRVISMTVTAVGSGGENAGNITLRVASAGATRRQINATENQDQDSHFTVPAATTGYLVMFYQEINKNEDIVVRYRRTDGDNGIFRTLLTSSLYQDQFWLVFKAPADPLVAKTDLKALAISTNAAAKATVIAQIILVED